MLILGVETSCDETAAAVVVDGCRVRSNIVSSQVDHARYGGVVPELAARRHVESLPWVVATALEEAGAGWGDLEGVAVTRGPGLIGALLAGWSYARGVARVLDLPWVGVHHLAAHVHGALMPALAAGRPAAFPLVALVVSGGHTSLYELGAPGRFRVLGETLDDAAGEAFDKVATLLGLGYPGGPVIDRLSGHGDPGAVPLPRARLDGEFDFSFSGLKAAVRREALRAGLRPGEPDAAAVRDLVASFQAAAVDMLVDTTARALAARPARGLVVAGGVAANRSLRAAVRELADDRGVELHLSPPELSTDNAAMVAGRGHERLARGETDGYELSARASWRLEAA